MWRKLSNASARTSTASARRFPYCDNRQQKGSVREWTEPFLQEGKRYCSKYAPPCGAALPFLAAEAGGAADAVISTATAIVRIGIGAAILLVAIAGAGLLWAAGAAAGARMAAARAAAWGAAVLAGAVVVLLGLFREEDRYTDVVRIFRVSQLDAVAGWEEIGDRTTGCALLGLGVRIATTHRKKLLPVLVEGFPPHHHPMPHPGRRFQQKQRRAVRRLHPFGKRREPQHQNKRAPEDSGALLGKSQTIRAGLRSGDLERAAAQAPGRGH